MGHRRTTSLPIPSSLPISSRYVNLSLERRRLPGYPISSSLPVSSRRMNLSLERRLLSDHPIPCLCPFPVQWYVNLSALLSDHPIPLSLPVSSRCVNLSLERCLSDHPIACLQTVREFVTRTQPFCLIVPSHRLSLSPGHEIRSWATCKINPLCFLISFS